VFFWGDPTSFTNVTKSYRSPEDDKVQRKALNRISKKLIACQNPEKVDIVAVARAKAAEKREGSESEAEMKKKKRKLEREKLERDGDVFGPDLKSIQ
jgi:cyclin H